MILFTVRESDTTSQVKTGPTPPQNPKRTRSFALSCTPCIRTHVHTHNRNNLSPFSTELSVLVCLTRASSWAGIKSLLFVEQRKKLSCGKREQQGGLTYSTSKGRNTQKSLIPTYCEGPIVHGPGKSQPLNPILPRVTIASVHHWEDQSQSES